MLEINAIFSDKMVLQRGKPVPIWGKCDENEVVSVSFCGQTKKATGTKGMWRAVLDPLSVARGAELRITTQQETIAISDVLVGDVWILGGQSNMEFRLKWDEEGATHIAQTHNSDIRYFDVPKVIYAGQQDDFSEYGIWRECTPENSPMFSAIGFYFAQELYELYGTPIGLVACNYGGTPACAWAAPGTLENTPARVWTEEYEAKLAALNLPVYEQEMAKNIFLKRATFDHNELWDTLMSTTNLPLLEQLAQQMPTTGDGIAGPFEPARPYGLYQQMVSTISPYAAKGVLWYQGEGDYRHAEVYDAAMGAVIDSWRSAWGEELPFLMMQLAPHSKWIGYTVKNFPLIRQRQEEMALSHHNVYITNIMDDGHEWDVHPKCKKKPARRFALLARNKVYHEDILAEAPVALSPYWQEGDLHITFTNTGVGLTAEQPDDRALHILCNGTVCQDFLVRIEGSEMVLSGHSIKEAQTIDVSYGMQNYCRCYIKNSAGIPLQPFVLQCAKK